MHVINEGLLESFSKKHNQARSFLESWLAVARDASWRHLMDVKQNYPGADGGVKDIYTVFNIKGNSYRLIASNHYPLQTIVIENVFTHSEYSQWSK